MYKFFKNRTTAVSKRRYKWISAPIEQKLNLAFDLIMEINEGYFSHSKKQDEVESLLDQIIFTILSLHKQLIVFWNVQSTSFNRQVTWAELIQKELRLLAGMKCGDTNLPMIYTLDWQKIHQVEFMENMTELHKFTHGKVVHIQNKYDGVDSALLINLVDDALYNLVLANAHIPTTKDEYDSRKKHISKAISSLNKMNRPLIAIFNIMDYSNHTMMEWSDMLSKELKLLYGLQRSDKVRFKNLE